MRSSLLLLLALLVGCQPEQADDARTVCFAFQDLETEFWVASYEAITSALEAADVRVIERNANEDANRQLEQVRDCIAQGVDGVLIIPQDGESAVTIAREANRAGIPVGIYNRPPANDRADALVVVADNERIAQETVEHLAEEARAVQAAEGRKVRPLIMVGDLGDQNAIARRRGFYTVIDANPDLFETPIEVPTKWDAATALANLEAALQATPDVDLIFTSSDFMYPQIRAVLEPLGRWAPAGEDGHVILGGLDGDALACRLMREGYVDATGVQDLFFEAEVILDSLTAAMAAGRLPDTRIEDPGFALTQANFAERAADMWGCRLDASAAP